MIYRSTMEEYPPLSARVVKTHGVSSSSCDPTVLRWKYKQWDSEAMELAVSSVLEKGYSVRRAAEEYNVPKSTLGDRITGKVLPGAHSGPPRLLTDQEEEHLATFLLQCASVGYPRSRLEVIAMIQRLCDSRGMKRTVTHGWWEAFCRRHQNITLRVSAPLSLARAKATSVDVIDKYFDMLEATMAEYDLQSKPCQIFNMDETGLPLDPKPPKVVCAVGEKNPSSIRAGNKAQITAVGCVSAAGYCIPPMVIYDRKTVSRDMVKDEIPGTLYGLSSKGWIDQELFDLWFHHFLTYAPQARPLLLLMDGYSTHYCPQTILSASMQQVVLFVLPPNTTHLAQPLDKGCYGPLKIEWRNVCQEYVSNNPGRIVTRHSFSELFAKAWMRSMTVKNIISAFRTCGIYPVDRSKVLSKLDSRSVSSKIPSRADLEVKRGLPYLPLLTPAPSCRKSVPSAASFTTAEFELFHERFEMGYSGSDERYKLWLEMYHPDEEDNVSLNLSVIRTPVKSSKLTSKIALAQPKNPFERLFCNPTRPSALPELKPKTSSRVLTSAESLKLLSEKERKKEEAQRKRDERLKRRKGQMEGVDVLLYIVVYVYVYV